MAAVTMTMCVVAFASLAAVQLQPLAATLRIDAGATAAAALPVGLTLTPTMMASHRVHGGRLLEDDPRHQVAAEMDAAGVARAAVLATVQQGMASPYLGYGSLNSNNAACPSSSCAGKPGGPYLPERRPCAKYYQCPSTPP